MVPNSFQPTEYTFCRKFCRVVTCSDIYKSNVVVKIVYTIWRDFPKLFYWKILIQYFAGIFISSVFLPLIFKVPDILLLFSVHGNNRLARFDKLSRFLIDVLKLCVPIRVRFTTCSIFWFACLLYPISSNIEPTVTCVIFSSYCSASFCEIDRKLSVVRDNTFSEFPYMLSTTIFLTWP